MCICRTTTSPEQVAAIDSTVIVPHDVFEYISFWLALSLSPLPRIRERAKWLTSTTFGAMKVGGLLE